MLLLTTISWVDVAVVQLFIDFTAYYNYIMILNGKRSNVHVIINNILYILRVIYNICFIPIHCVPIQFKSTHFTLQTVFWN